MLVRDSRIFVHQVLRVRDIQAATAVRGLAVEHSEVQVFPAGYHVDNAGELEHEQRRRIERILISRLKKVNRPYVNVLQVRVPRKKRVSLQH